MPRLGAYRPPWSTAQSAQDRARTVKCHQDHKAFWFVIQRKCNHSAFSGYRETPSDYSSVQCTAPGCGRVWRTKAAYVDDLPDRTYIPKTGDLVRVPAPEGGYGWLGTVFSTTDASATVRCDNPLRTDLLRGEFMAVPLKDLARVRPA